MSPISLVHCFAAVFAIKICLFYLELYPAFSVYIRVSVLRMYVSLSLHAIELEERELSVFICSFATGLFLARECYHYSLVTCTRLSSTPCLLPSFSLASSAWVAKTEDYISDIPHPFFHDFIFRQVFLHWWESSHVYDIKKSEHVARHSWTLSR
jgi:hypothetical protein